MAIKEITNITIVPNGSYKTIVNPKERVIATNPKSEIVLDSDGIFIGTLRTPVINTIKYGTVEEIDNYIKDLDVKEVKAIK